MARPTQVEQPLYAEAELLGYVLALIPCGLARFVGRLGMGGARNPSDLERSPSQRPEHCGLSVSCTGAGGVPGQGAGSGGWRSACGRPDLRGDGGRGKVWVLVRGEVSPALSG